MTPRILIVAGSDSGGGAGIQADIRTVTMLGGHPMTAITAITAQNTLGVTGVHPIPPTMVAQQMQVCIDDIGVDAVKIGMIGSATTAHAVADVIETLRDVPIVFDPVMIASSGAVLADEETTAAFGRLMRLATVVTPNCPELAALGGVQAVLDIGSTLLAKGGHAEGDVITDRLIGRDGEIASWSGSRIETRHSHGTGCTLASAIAEGLGRGLALTQAVERARAFVREALVKAPGLGAGHGPMGHHLVRMEEPRGF